MRRRFAGLSNTSAPAIAFKSTCHSDCWPRSRVRRWTCTAGSANAIQRRSRAISTSATSRSPSASPERFLKVTSDGQVETRPIKGTRPRGRTPAEDDINKKALLASVKDRAENVMIVDLLRNDLGRVCEYGSVRVAKLCELESYRTVHHLVSEVVGRLRLGMTAFHLLRAAFPGGSVTGAPKVRAMEIIAELEPTARGPYCGSLGYIGFDGAMDTNVLIRTFTLGRGWAQFPVGGGIVADSDPACEYEETLHKAAGLLRALE